MPLSLFKRARELAAMWLLVSGISGTNDVSVGSALLDNVDIRIKHEKKIETVKFKIFR